ncbi:MAG: hypothetical protein ACE5GB_02470 [Acidimicrobiales bacterium]
MKRIRLGIDLDGVVVDFNRGWVERYNRDFDACLSPDDIVEWDAPLELTHFADMSEFWSWARTCGEGRSLFRPLRPYPGALEALGTLAAEGHRLVILTTKPHFAVHDTYEWLAEHRVPTTEVHILDHKSAVECDVYVDDADHNLAALLRDRPGAVVCRYVRPWNRHHPGARDVEGWSDLREVVWQVAGAGG